MDLAWNDVRLFLAIAESGSITVAAKKLGLGQPTVSRNLAQLEYVLGYKLFRRGASGAKLTPAAERLLEPARKMAEWAGEVQRAAARDDQSPQGVVRVAAPPGVAFDFLAPFAVHLKRKVPALRLEVLSAVHFLDLSRGEADLALRHKAPTDRDLVTVASLQHHVRAYAARSYVEKLPKKYGLADVDFIAWAPPYENLPPNPQLEAAIPGFQPIFTSDNFLVKLRAAEAGMGAVILGDMKHRFSLPTSLVPLSLAFGPHSRASLHLVCAKSALDIPRVRTVSDLLVAELQRIGEKQRSSAA